jgi:hypothetical protein
VKTISLKKVSAVAVDSLGFGLLSVVPANAGAGDIATTASIASIKVTAPTLPTANAAAAFTIGFTTASEIATTVADTVLIRAAITSAPTGGIAPFTGAFVAVTGARDGLGTAGASGAGKLTAAVAAAANSVWAAGASYSIGTMTFTPQKAGSYSISFYHDQNNNSALDNGEVFQTSSITVGAANGYSNTVSTIYSTKLSTAAAASAATAATNGNPTRDKAMSTTRAGTISVSLNTATNTSAAAFVAKVEAIVSGSGYVDVVNEAAPGNTTGCYAAGATTPLRSDSITTISQQVVTVYPCSDGTAGKGTITIKVTDTDGVVYTLGTVDTLFTDAATTLGLVATNYTIAPASGGDIGKYTGMGTRDSAAKIPATILVTKDSAGNAVTHANTPSGLTSNTAVLTGGTCTVDDGNVTYGSGGAGYWNCYVTSATAAKSGDTATITWRVLNADGVTYTTLTPVTYTIGGVIAKEVVTLNKATFAPGEAMTLTVTATDAAGKPAYDGQAVFAAQTTASMTITGLPTTTLLTKGGTAITTANTLFAPSTAGAFTIFGTGTDAAATKLSVSGSVDNGNAALLTQIDALNAKIVALNALIAKIMKKLGVK